MKGKNPTSHVHLYLGLLLASIFALGVVSTTPSGCWGNPQIVWMVDNEAIAELPLAEAEFLFGPIFGSKRLIIKEMDFVADF